MKYTIIGGGIGGLATALAFERNGIDYEVYEQAEELTAVGAGILLAPNALQVLESLDVLSEVQTTGNYIDWITIGKADFSPLSDMPQDKIKDTFGYNTVSIHRAQLQKILYSQLPKEKVHLGYGFQSFTELDSGKLRVNFTNQISVETDYIIGADGIHSKVRKQLFPESKLRYSGQTCWRGVVDIQLDPNFKHKAFELWGDGIRFGCSGVDENQAYWFAVTQSEANQKDQGPVKNKLLKMYQSFHPLVHTLINTTDETQIIRHDINDLNPLKRWYSDKICLIGDAGHATTPNMGQGGAQAIEDAYYLSKCIQNNPQGKCFKEFQDKRKKKVNRIVKQSWITGQMAHWTYGIQIRNFMIKYMPKPIMDKQIMDMYVLE